MHFLKNIKLLSKNSLKLCQSESIRKYEGAVKLKINADEITVSKESSWLQKKVAISQSIVYFMYMEDGGDLCI